MAIVNLPLGSASASGKFAGAFVYARSRGKNIVRQLVIPANPRTTTQIGNRAALAGVSRLYVALSAADKATWDELAASQNLDPRNVHARRNLQRFRDGQAGWYSSETLGATAAPEDFTSSDLVTNGNIKTVSANLAGATAGNWGLAWLRVPAGDAMPTAINASNLFAIVVAEDDGIYSIDHNDGGVDQDYYAVAIGRDAQMGDIQLISPV